MGVSKWQTDVLNGFPPCTCMGYVTANIQHCSFGSHRIKIGEIDPLLALNSTWFTMHETLTGIDSENGCIRRRARVGE